MESKDQLGNIKAEEDLELNAFKTSRNLGRRTSQHFRKGSSSGGPPGGVAGGPRGRGSSQWVGDSSSTPNPSLMFCRLCHLAKLPRPIFTSHRLGDSKCTQLSAIDKQLLHSRNKTMAGMATEDDMDEVAAAFGYLFDSQDMEDEDDQVGSVLNDLFTSDDTHFRSRSTLS